jgi:hypothetical protein
MQGHESILWGKHGLGSPNLRTDFTAPSLATMFINPKTGKAFTGGEYSLQHSSLVFEHTGVSTTPHKARNSFAASRLQAQPGSAAAAAFDNDGAAHLMGNSVRAWREHYFPEQLSLQSQAAMAGMAGLRQTLTEPIVSPARRRQVILSDSDDDVEIDLSG